MALLLLIDEDEDSKVLQERVLVRHGHEVATFTKGQEAVNWLKNNTPDLALISGGKHGEKAGELIALLQGNGVEPCRIVLSANEASLGTLKKAFKGSVAKIMPKTAELEKLESLVRSGLSG